MKPMLADNADLARVRYPVIVSPKLDGVRGLVLGGRLMSRQLKRIPNLAAQAAFGRPEYEGLDGELIVGPNNTPDAYRRSISVMASASLRDKATFYVFDIVGQGGYLDRLQRLADLLLKHPHPQIVMLECKVVMNEEELLEYEEHAVARGFEGIMLRKVDGRYKEGRSTVGEGILLKLKRFVDGEAEVLGVEEEMANNNVAMRNELGRTARSTAKAGLSGKGSAGALIVRDLSSGIEFRIGGGFTMEERDLLWRGRRLVVGQVVKYKHQPHGAKDKPRFPIYLGPRKKWDL